MIIADESANPEFTAAALLAQAEHNRQGESLFSIFGSETFTDTEKQIHKQIGSLAQNAIEHVLKVGFLELCARI